MASYRGNSVSCWVRNFFLFRQAFIFRIDVCIEYRTTKGGNEMLNNFVWSIFQGYKEAKESSRDPFKELEKSWYLYEIDDLDELRKQATNKEQHNLILDHMYKYDATQVDYFRQIEKKIINYYWEE